MRCPNVSIIFCNRHPDEKNKPKLSGGTPITTDAGGDTDDEMPSLKDGSSDEEGWTTVNHKKKQD